MIAYLASFFLRTDLIDDNKLAKRLCYAVASLIIWGVMYIFVFSMINLRLALESDDPQQHAIRVKSLRRNQIYVAIAFIIFAFCDLFNLTLSTLNKFPVAEGISNFLRCIPKLAIDAYLFSAFLSALNFFVKKKIEYNRRVFGH